MNELMAAVQTPAIDWSRVPRAFHSYKGQVSAVCQSLEDCEDLVRWFGNEDFCPFQPVLVIGKGFAGQVTGLGQSTVSEIRDEAVARWQIMTERIAKTGRAMDFDAMRERLGMMRKEDVDAAFRTALMDRIAAHRASPVTDPFRQPLHVRVNGKTVHTVAVISDEVTG